MADPAPEEDWGWRSFTGRTVGNFASNCISVAESADQAKWRYAPGGGECSELSYEPLPSRMAKTGVLLCSWRVRFRRRRARQLRRQASAVEHRQPETDDE